MTTSKMKFSMTAALLSAGFGAIQLVPVTVRTKPVVARERTIEAFSWGAEGSA